LIIDLAPPWGEPRVEEATNLDFPDPLSSLSIKGLSNMKTTLVLAALGVISLGLANTAQAKLVFDPAETAFKATGSITVSTVAVSLPCTAVLRGRTAKTTAKIAKAEFSGLSCIALTASGLPWDITIANNHNVVIHGVEVDALVLGLCGPGNVPAFLTSTGKLTITAANLTGSGVLPCSVSGTLHTKPAIKIN
jgi:hypothetical protein